MREPRSTWPIPEAIATSLRAACDALRASADDVQCIGVTSHLPAGFVVTDVMDFTERLADEYRLVAHMYVHDGGLEVRFERGHQPR